MKYILLKVTVEVAIKAIHVAALRKQLTSACTHVDTYASTNALPRTKPQLLYTDCFTQARRLHAN